jgi:hypothetical protein
MNKAFKILPKNYLSEWGEFEDWAEGVGSAPTGWLIATSAIIAQETTDFKYGTYSASITGSGGEGGLYRTIPNGDTYAGRTFKLGLWAKSASTAPYIKLSDGVKSVTYHVDGTNAMTEVTTPAMQLDKNATELRVDLICPSTVQCFFDSSVLCEGEDLFTNFDGNTVIDAFQPSLNMKQEQFEISQQDGSFIPSTHLSGRPIRMRGTTVGSDAASARSHFDSLMKGLLSWQPEEKKHLYLYEDRVAEVFLKSINWQYAGTQLDFIKFNINLNNPKSTTRSLNKFRKREIVSGTIQEFNLVYNGSANSKPLISFIANQGGDIGTCQLENMTTGESVIYSGTVPNGVALDIDCDVGTVFNSSVNKIADFGASDFIKLVRGTNYFRFTGSNCQINIDWFDRYL